MFRSVFVTLVVAVVCFCSSGSAQSDSADRAGIKAVLDAHGAAWTRGDADAATAILTDDADWVSGGGRVFVGRPAITQMHKTSLCIRSPSVGSL
jgi:ketosteroid isomerase-like protein